MFHQTIRKRVLSALLALLLLQPGLPVRAEETQPEETTEPAVQETMAETTEPTVDPEETEPAETTEETEFTEPTEATESTEPSIPSPQVLTVAEVLQLPTGTDGIYLEGTVVFVSGTQMILQDETGGIRASVYTDQEIRLGDILLAAGRRSGGFQVERFEITGTGELPAVESGLEEDRSDLRICVRGAVLGQRTVTQNGWTYALDGSIPEGIAIGDRVDVWGVLIDGVFYADTILPGTSDGQPDTGNSLGGWNFYFGQLHAHSDISDGIGSPEEAFAYARAAENLDFFALTDHSDSFDNSGSGAVHLDGTAISEAWAAGKAAAAAVTDEHFVGMFGYEMTWQEDLAIGHINTFGTPGWQTRDQMDTLDAYLEAVAQVPGSVSQFNHPGPQYGDFYNFSRYDPRQDQRMHLLEVGGEGGFTAYDSYTKALEEGWHLAPANNQNNHNGIWGTENDHRTVVLAQELTETAVLDAIRNYRVYATEDGDLKILYKLNDVLMGSVMETTTELTAQITLEDPTDATVGLVEVITDGGRVAVSADVEGSSGSLSLEVSEGGSYYYLRITQPDGDVAVTAPVWLETYEDLGVESFEADQRKPEIGTTAQLTLTLYNHEMVPFVVESVEFTAGEELLSTVLEPGTMEPAGTLEVPVSCIGMEPGAMTVSAVVSGKIAGLPRTFRTSLTLHWQPLQAPMLSIGDARKLNPGETCKIRGYVTAGTAKACNSFQNSIYLQDDTGGIQIADFTKTGIQLGTPMEVEGVLLQRDGNQMLALTDYAVVPEAFYRYDPGVMSNRSATDYAANGGELLQIEGAVVSVTKTADGKGVSRFTLRDIHGDLATVLVEEGIGSGAYGVNELASEVKLKRTVRAKGLLHMDEFGQRVLRVRNCDEVVYVPPRKDPTNPKTGHWLAWLFSRN